MERHFEIDLSELKERLLWMGSLAERAVHQAIHAVLEAQESLAQAVLTKNRPSTSCRSRLTTASCSCWRCTN